jgi:hypothetical protein
MSFFDRADAFPGVGPRFTEIESPYVIISRSPGDDEGLPGAEEIILSERDGTLQSYTEEWNGKQYDIVLELQDPDGIFVQRMFSMYIQGIRDYFRNFHEDFNSVAADQQIFSLYRKERERLRKGISTDEDEFAHLDNELVGGDGFTDRNRARFNRDLDELLEGDSVQAINNINSILGDPEAEKRLDNLAVQNAIRGTGAQELLEKAGFGLDYYISLGYGHEKYKNSTGFRKVFLKKLFMKQDSGDAHLVTVVLQPDISQTEAPDESGKPPHELNSEHGAPKYFPTGADRFKPPVLYFARYNTAPGQNIGMDTIAIQPEEVLNDKGYPSLVHSIETLLEGYLSTSYGSKGIVFLNPALQQAITDSISFGDEGAIDITNGPTLHLIAKKLKKCGIHVNAAITNAGGDGFIDSLRSNPYGPQAVLADLAGSYGSTAQFFEDLNLGFLSDAYTTLQESANEAAAFVAQDVEVVYTLHLAVPRNEGDRIKTVKKIIDDLYKEFDIHPERTTYKISTKKQQNIDILSQLYPLRNGSARLGGRFFVRQGHNPAQILENDVDNLIIIGDAFFIESMVFPFNGAYARNEFEQFMAYITRVMGVPKTGALNFGDFDLFPNAVRFVKGANDNDLRSYIDKYTELIVRPELNETLIPDEFSSRFTDNQKYQLLRNTPLFMAGTENSNVISVQSKDDAFTFPSFQSFFNLNKKVGIQRARDFVAYGYNTTQNNRLPTMSEEEVNSIVDDVLKDVFADSGVVRVVESILSTPIDDTEAVASLRTMYGSIIRDIANSKLVVNRSIDPKAITNYLVYLNTLSQRTRTIVIKTSPAFYIDEGYIGHPAFFFHSNPFNTGSDSPFDTLSVLSGLYKIIGYKHTVNETECQTEVVLLRNIFDEAINLTAKVGAAE